MSLLLQYSSSHGNNTSSISGAVYQNQIETPGEIFNWLAILWERGFNHDNPQGNSEVNVLPSGVYYVYGNIYLKLLFLPIYRTI